MFTAKRSFLLLVAAAALSAGAEKQPYSRYATIVDRQMFGPLPAGFDPAKLPSEVTKTSQKELTKEQEQLKSAVRFSVINMTPDGQVAVGFTDSSDGKNPRHYYLKVGESRGGWLVKEADPETATMTVAKGEIEVTLTIGGDSAKDAAATAKAGAANQAASGAVVKSRLLGGARRPSRKELQENVAKTAEELAQMRRDRQTEREERERERAAELEAEAQQRQEMLQQLTNLKDELKASREAAKNAEKEGDENDNVE